MNKKGDEVVEAAIVLPIVILTILSLIMLIIYFYSCLNGQISLHTKILTECENSQEVYRIVKIKEETSKGVGGLISLIMRREIIARHYSIDEASVVRLGEYVEGLY